MRLRLRDERLEVLARAAGCSAADLAAELQIDLLHLQALRPDRDILPGGGLEVVCDLFGLTEDEYSFFSPYVPVDKASRSAFVRAKAEGLARARAAIAKRENDRERDFKTSFLRTMTESRASWKRLPKGPRTSTLSPLERNRRAQQRRLLTKVDKELGRARLPESTAHRYRRHFECLADALSLAGLDLLMYNLRRIRFFPSLCTMNEYLLKRRFQKVDEKRCLGMWRSQNGTLFLADGEEAREPLGSEREIFAHEIAHAIDAGPFLKSDRISNRTEWQLAWSIEVDCDELPLTEYARTSECEGFAEFGALALTNPVFARRAFPRCWAVWRHHHLDADVAVPADSPSVPVQPMSTAGAIDAIPSIAATAADGATAA